MYKEFLSDKEIQYLMALTKVANTEKKKVSQEPMVKKRVGAKDAIDATATSRMIQKSVMYPAYDSFVYDIDDNLVEKKKDKRVNGDPNDLFDISFSDIIIGKIVHRISTWCHIPFDNLESFSIDVFDSKTDYRSVYNSSTSENFNARLATVFIPLTQFDEEEDDSLADNIIGYGGHDNVVVFPQVEPSYQQRRISKATFSDSASESTYASSKGSTGGTTSGSNICNDPERKLTINANKGDALLIWSLQVGGEPEPASAYVHCGLPDLTKEEGVENAIGIRSGSDVGSHGRSSASGKRYVATAHFTVSGIQPSSGGTPAKVERKIYTIQDEEEDRPCADKTTACVKWAASGECAKNPKYMLDACAKSCGNCR